MAQAVASSKSTGGGGFLFEDKACAWFLTHLLANEPPLGTDLGCLERLDFQTRADGWFLDDLLLSLAAREGRRRCALSVKSSVQFTASKAPSDFVRTAWEQFLHEGSPRFDEATDYMALVTAPLPPDTRTSLAFLVSTARDGDPHVLPARYAQPGWASETKRSLFGSFACPADLAERHGLTSQDIARLLARLRFLEFDFELLTSESEKAAVERCRRVLRSGEVDEAMKLWDRLLQISASRRPTAGFVTRESLLKELRSEFRLADLPQHRADWIHLTELTTASAARIRDSIGGQVRLSRDGQIRKLAEAVEAARAVVLLGPSGAGKSAIAKSYASQVLANGNKFLWFEAGSFERVDFPAFEGDLKLTHGLSALLASVPDDRALLVLDGIDRLYNERAFALVASLLTLVKLHEDGSPWHVVLTCQTQEWLRLHQYLLRAGVAATWRIEECEPLSVEELRPVWSAIPRTARLQYQENLRHLLVNLKILDLIAVRLIAGGEVPTSGWVGESSVAAWFWESEIVCGADGPPRGRLVSLLAERQADALRLGVPLHQLAVSDLGPLSGLVRDRVCRQTSDDQVVFEHDLFGDWARLRLLVSQSDSLVDFLRQRLDSPLWHRALRLYGIHLLEHVGDIEGWRSTFSALAAQGNEGAGDLLLESTIFAANPLALFEQIRPDLIRDDGKLLRRLLARFLAFATLPDPHFMEMAHAEGHNPIRVAAQYRYPNWPYWPPMLQFLHRHRDELVAAAPAAVGRVVDLWLNYAPEGARLRREAAELGLILGTAALQARRVYRRTDREHRKQSYRVALMAASELPDKVAAFALRASERSQEVEEEDSDSEDVDLLPMHIRCDPRFDPNEPPPGPWPDGPRSAVDDDFRHVVLETAAILPLFRVRPATAWEVVLATLIKARRRFAWCNDWYESTHLDLYDGLRWHPPLYVHGPFLEFLRTNFEGGLELILRLVHFATGRWSHYASVEASRYEAEHEAQGEQPVLLGHMMREWHQPPGKVLVPLEGGDREFLGDGRVYGWSAGIGNPPVPIEAALMALEQYLYMELDGGRSIGQKVRAVLDRARSVAFLKVLCDVGRRDLTLFEGPIRPLLAVPEVYSWDIRAIVQGRFHLMIGAVMHGDWFFRLAKAFHELEHRSIDLRHVAVKLLFACPASRGFFAEARGRWEKRLAAEPDQQFRDFLQQLITTCDIGNYRLEEHSEHGHVIVNVRARELEAGQAAERQALEAQMLMTSFPARCRQILDAGTALDDKQLESFWSDVQGIASASGIAASADPGDHAQPTTQPGKGDQQGPPRAGAPLFRMFRILKAMCERVRNGMSDPREQPESAPKDRRPEFGLAERGRDDAANAITGAAAVLVRLHGDWLAKDPERKEWCLKVLRFVVLNPPPRQEYDVPESVASWTCDCFAAEAIPVLWARDPANAELRQLAARLVFAPHYVAVEILFRRCAEQRAALGADFGRLRRLLFEWAHVRNRVVFVEQARGVVDALTEEQIRRFDESVKEWASDHVRAFVERRSSEVCGAWPEMDDPTRFTAIDGSRERWHRTYYLDLRLIRAAHAWMPTPEKSLNPEERRDWLGFWREALAFVLAEAAGPRGRDRYGLPSEDDRWVLDCVAAVVSFMDPTERPDHLWSPVLDLPCDAHHWVEDFLQSFHRHGLSQNPAPPHFPSIRHAMIEHVLAKAAQNRAGSSWPFYEEVSEALFGIDGFTRGCWEERHRALANQSLGLLERWILRGHASPRHLAAVTRWLKLPAAGTARLPGLVVLDRALTEGEAKHLNDLESVAEPLASLLAVVWQDDEPRLRQDAAAFAGFRRLLRRLADQQNATALNLVGRLGGLQ